MCTNQGDENPEDGIKSFLYRIFGIENNNEDEMSKGEVGEAILKGIISIGIGVLISIIEYYTSGKSKAPSSTPGIESSPCKIKFSLSSKILFWLNMAISILSALFSTISALFFINAKNLRNVNSENADANAETAKSSGYFWLVIAAITCLISFGVSQVSPISNAAPGAVKMINNILFGVSIGSLLWAGIEAATI